MEVILAKNSGFCSGVQKAVDTAESIYGDNVYILGELIHNSTVTKKIESLGTKTVNDIDEVSGGTVIIRSHGVGRDTLEELERRGIKVINCTCPFVMRTQQIVGKYHDEGYAIFIAGERNHPEVIGLQGWCENSAIVIGDDYEKLDLKGYEKVCLVSQTTYSDAKFQKILEFFMKFSIKTLEVFPTICYTTKERQKEAEILSKTCDAMVVVGGGNSSNTKKLTSICRENCGNVYFISDPKELDYKKFKDFKKVGIVAGASTPKAQSMEVFLKMEEVTEVKSTNAMEEAMTAMGDEQKFRRGQCIVATISSATDDGLALYINNTKKEIMLPKEEIDCENYDKAEYSQKVGEDIEVMITGLNPVTLSQKAIKLRKEEEEFIAKIKDGEIFTVTIDGTNKGGLTAKLGSYDVFVPSSQIRIGFVKDLEKYKGKQLRLKAEKVENNGRRKQIVGSQRVILEAEKAERDAAQAAKEEAFFSAVAEGDVVTGTVVRFAQFGAFVDVNGFDCLAHISDLSWTNAATPADVLEIGKQYEFKVLKCDRETKKVSLGYKQLQPKPWQLAADKYAIGDVIKGKVVRIVNFGAFVEVEKGIDGLVHVSQISHEWLEDPTTALKVGEEIEAKIVDMDVEKEKMTLSIKALTPAPAKEEKPARAKKAEGEEAAEGEEKPKRQRKEKKVDDDGEPREWNEGGVTGVSLGDILNNNN